MSGQPNPRVGLFVTCLVDAIRPGIGFSALQLLEEAGCRVEVPELRLIDARQVACHHAEAIAG